LWLLKRKTATPGRRRGAAVYKRQALGRRRRALRFLSNSEELFVLSGGIREEERCRRYHRCQREEEGT
jgi:hypothetical protein